MRHLERRGAQDRGDLAEHFAGNSGRHDWHPEDVDRAVGELIDGGFADEIDGLIRPTVIPPL